MFPFLDYLYPPGKQKVIGNNYAGILIALMNFIIKKTLSMKRKLMYLATATALMFSACNDSGNSSTVTTTDSTTMATSSNDVGMGNSGNSSETLTYVDVITNKPVAVMQDTVSHQYVDMNTHQPLTYYYNPISHDTFDARGRIVNNALVLTNGDYTIDESKIKSNDDAFKMKNGDMKMKMDDDGDMKMKDGDMKVKDKDDLYKEKTDSSKLKVKDGKMKIKDN